ncbi:MAG: hypothetical protein KA170_01900 [Candidatus Promineofilum sp.]|nr:hypothetical protein [Promineifilum sp.]
MDDIINPYIAGNPVTGQEMFFGREDIFEFIRQTLTGKHRDQVIVLYGQRRTGKTSILYQLHRRLDPRYLCIFVDLHGLLMESEGAFLWELASQIRRILGRDYGIVLPTPDRGAFETDPRSFFANDFLDQVWQAIGDHHVLLMIDEAVRLQEQVLAGKLDKSIFEFLRFLMQHYERLNFLFSLGSGLEQMEKEYSFLFNVALYKKISFLEREAAVDLITQPVRDQYTVAPDAIDRILQITACHPYYTQLLCHSLFNRWRQKSGATVTTDDVEAVMEEVVERGLAVLKHNWEESTPGEKAVLGGLAAVMGERNRPVGRDEVSAVWGRLGVALPPDVAARAMKSLAARDILAGDEQVKFTVDLVHFWVRKFQRLEWVKDEIQEQVKAWPVVAAPAAPALVQAEAPPPTEARPRPGSLRLLLGGVALLAIAVLLAAAVLNWGPFGGGAEESVKAETGIVVPGGDALLVNDLVAADGAVWAATESGLVRWTSEGRAIVIPGDEFGFPDAPNQALAVAEDGSLWIGGGGVSHVEPAEDGMRFLAYYDRDSGLGMSVVRALMAEGEEVWAGGTTTHESSLSWFDGESWYYDAVSLAEPEAMGLDPAIWSMVRDTDGSLWLGLVDDGILRWDGTDWRYWGPAEGVGGAEEAGLDDARVRGLIQDEQGTLWAAAGGRGLLRFVPQSDGWQAVAVGETADLATAVAAFDDGSIWLGQDSGAIFRSGDFGATWMAVAAPEDELGADITAIVQDEAGRIWVSSYGGGVSVWEGEAWTHLQQ